TVGLEVQPDDLHGADFLDRIGQQVHLGADQIWYLHGDVPGMDRDPDVARRGDLGVGVLADLPNTLGCELGTVHLEVHARVVRLHVAARDERSVVPVDDATEDMESRVHAHERVPAFPVHAAVHLGAGGGEGGVR